MRVLQLLPALNSGGVERSTLEIARALVAAGHESRVVSAGGRLVAQLEAEGSRHLRLDIGRKSLLTLFRLGRLRAILREYRPDIVHVRSRLPAWMLRWALRGLEGPRPALVSTVHGLNSVSRYSAIMTRADRVIAVSDCVAAYLAAHYPQCPGSRVRVIPRAVDLDEFRPLSSVDAHWRAEFERAFPQLAGGRVLLLPGRGTRLKGHADAIELLSRLHSEGAKDLRLLLAGAREAGREGYIAELEALAASRGVAAALAISPPRSDMRELYAASTLVLQLSRKPEAFGRTVIEALAMQKPVLGWDHGGVGDLLRQHFAEGAVALGDTQALLVAARRMLEQVPVPHCDLSRYQLSNMQAATLAVYTELVPVPAQ